MMHPFAQGITPRETPNEILGKALNHADFKGQADVANLS
jgi:hypothetical protein